MVCNQTSQGDIQPCQTPTQHPFQRARSREAPSLQVDNKTSHSPVVRLFRRNSICSACPACSARARGVGASGSPEKQLTPAPQPRSAWVSARSVVVTAAHRAWTDERGGGAGSVQAGMRGQWKKQSGGEKEEEEGRRHLGLGANLQV